MALSLSAASGLSTFRGGNLSCKRLGCRRHLVRQQTWPSTVAGANSGGSLRITGGRLRSPDRRPSPAPADPAISVGDCPSSSPGAHPAGQIVMLGTVIAFGFHGICRLMSFMWRFYIAAGVACRYGTPSALQEFVVRAVPMLGTFFKTAYAWLVCIWCVAVLHELLTDR